MGTRQQKWRIAALASALLLGLAACGGGTTAKNEARYGTDQFISNFFPYIEAGQSTATANVVEQVLPRVFIAQPNLTTDYDHQLLTADPRQSVVTTPQQQVTYRLSPQAVWNDRQGKTTPITAEDFVATWKLNSRTGDFAQCRSVATGYDRIQNVESKDNGHTVLVTFKEQYADWTGLFTPILPASAFSMNDTKTACQEFNKGWSVSSPELAPFSGGPFQVKSVDQTAKTITVARNDNYWGPKAKLDRIIFRTVSSGAQELKQAMQNNELQVIYPQPQLDLVKALNSLKSVRTEISFGSGFEHLDFNTGNPLLKNVEVRRAIALAIDRTELSRRTIAQFDSRAKVLNNRIFVNNQPGYQDHAGEYANRHLDQAKTLLAQAGFTAGSDGILQRNGQRLSFTLVTTENNQMRTDTVEIIRQQLKEAGIEIRPVYRSSNVFFGGPETPGSMAAGDFDMSIYAWLVGNQLTQFEPIHACPPGPGNRRQNVGIGCDPAVDQAIAKTFHAVNPDDAIAQWNKIDELLWNDMFTLPLFQKPTFLAYNKQFTNIQDNPSPEGPLFNAGQWALNTATRE